NDLNGVKADLGEVAAAADLKAQSGTLKAPSGTAAPSDQVSVRRPRTYDLDAT
ncbi:MAG: hypothetical protein QOC94_969, partial [Actinoplanes sp.]|nr:hypothetical protein [Actinoplanes sp.]